MVSFGSDQSNLCISGIESSFKDTSDMLLSLKLKSIRIGFFFSPGDFLLPTDVFNLNSC